jgi:hypothetical protein
MAPKHLIRLLTVGISVFFMGHAVFATQPRVDGMGGGVKHWTIDDETNIFDYPSLLVRYGDMTHVDNITVVLDANGDPAYPAMRFGYHAQLTDDMVLAVYGGVVNNVTRGVGDGNNISGNAFTGASAIGPGAQASQAAFAGGGPDGNAASVGGNPINQVDLNFGLMYALNIGPDFRLGVSMSVLTGNADQEQPANLAQVDQGAFLIDLGVGVGYSMETFEFELSVGFEVGGVDDYRDIATGSQPPIAPLIQHWAVDQHIGLRLNGRFLIDFYGGTQIVPYLRFQYASQSVTQLNVPLGSPSPNGTWNGIDFLLGADIRIEPFEGVIVSPGLAFHVVQQSLAGGSVTERDLDRIISFPIYGVGVEVAVFDWLDFRFGAHQSVDYVRESVTSPDAANPNIVTTDEKQHTQVTTHLATGFGFNFPVADSMLSIDLNVNPLHWLKVPYLWTGAVPGVAGGSLDVWGMSGAIKYDW